MYVQHFPTTTITTTTTTTNTTKMMIKISFCFNYLISNHNHHSIWWTPRSIRREQYIIISIAPCLLVAPLWDHFMPRAHRHDRV
jgi:hypothetical protein